MLQLIKILLLGAYFYQCLVIVIRMMLRCRNTEDHSPWQRHIYFLWGLLMTYVVLQLPWYMYATIAEKTETFYQYEEYIRIMTLVCIQIISILLWTMIKHRILTFRQICRHLVPGFGLCALTCLMIDQVPYIKYVLYLFELLYSIIMSYMMINRSHIYYQFLSQSYSDVHHRQLKWLVHLIWMFGAIFVLYLLFGMMYSDLATDCLYYISVIGVWYYIGSNINHMEDTNIISEVIEESEIENNEKASSLREQTRQRIEETLENTCVSKRLYLNADLTVNDLAKELNTNRTYIFNYFSDHHTTFLKYINDLRAEYAMYQFKTTDHPLKSVMSDSGFRHMDTFKQAFLSRYNIDPRTYFENIKASAVRPS